MLDFRMYNKVSAAQNLLKSHVVRTAGLHVHRGPIVNSNVIKGLAVGNYLYTQDVVPSKLLIFGILMNIY